MTTQAADAGWQAADTALLERIGRGEEAAFAQLVASHGAAMLRMASYHSPNRAVAEEVVQETWIAFLQGMDRFEGRSKLRTWLFGILINQARKIARREKRTITFDPGPDTEEAHGVDSNRYNPPGQRWGGHWKMEESDTWPKAWRGLPEDEALTAEVRGEILKALEDLPASQQTVFALRDVEGMAAPEVCDMLEISEANQRVLLHRARCRIRAHLEVYLND